MPATRKAKNGGTSSRGSGPAETRSTTKERTIDSAAWKVRHGPGVATTR